MESLHHKEGFQMVYDGEAFEIFRSELLKQLSNAGLVEITRGGKDKKYYNIRRTL